MITPAEGMTGRLTILGLGPGAADLVAPRARAALDQATDLIGYGPYLARVPERPGQRRHASDNRQELERANHAIDLALDGARVAVVSSGDAGVFGMAAAVFEALDRGDPTRRSLLVEVIPGITAVQAASARIGALCGGDYCVVNLSDNLKPFETVCERVASAVAAGFVTALYNPVSRARPWQLNAVLDRVRTRLPGTVPVLFATAVSRPDERLVVRALSTASAADADMRTVVLIGTPLTRTIPRPNGAAPWLYTPRSVPAGTSGVADTATPDGDAEETAACA